ncbi:MAG: hypothetical protein KDC57_00380 [Saprospiraceae bacterium]|nr:hypothetical protein [Saprospiraceae bacterium]
MMRNIIVFASFLVLVSCKQEPQVTSDQVVGAWEVVGAERDGKETETLNGAYFEFSDNGTVTSNYLGEEETSLYSLEASSITQTRPDQSHVNFNVERLGLDTMVMTASIRNIPFRFVMKKIDQDPD